MEKQYPTKGSKVYSEKRMKERITQKYGEKFLFLLKKRQECGFVTLRTIADMYGISRERVRQIEKIIYNNAPWSIHKNDIETCQYNPLRKLAEYKTGSNAHFGAIAEANFYNKCNELGYKIEYCNNKKIDIIVNNKKIDVKNCAKPIFTSNGSKTPTYRYTFSIIQYNECDFLACYHNTVEDFFIIPMTYIYSVIKKPNKINSIYIPQEKTNYFSSKNRYWEFQGRFDLISQ